MQKYYTMTNMTNIAHLNNISNINNRCLYVLTGDECFYVVSANLLKYSVYLRELAEGNKSFGSYFYPIFLQKITGKTFQAILKYIEYLDINYHNCIDGYNNYNDYDDDHNYNDSHEENEKKCDNEYQKKCDNNAYLNNLNNEYLNNDDKIIAEMNKILSKKPKKTNDKHRQYFTFLETINHLQLPTKHNILTKIVVSDTH